HQAGADGRGLRQGRGLQGGIGGGRPRRSRLHRRGTPARRPPAAARGAARRRRLALAQPDRPLAPLARPVLQRLMVQARLSWQHALLAIAVTAVWGTNFVVIRWALDDLPPFTLAALRFTFAALPAIAFVRRPPVPWRDLAAYGLLIGAGQFGLLFLAMDGRISPGLASLVVQAQVFFTVGLAMLMSREALRGFQWAALALGAAGLVLIGLRTDGDATLPGLALLLLAALCWAG